MKNRITHLTMNLEAYFWHQTAARLNQGIAMHIVRALPLNGPLGEGFRTLLCSAIVTDLGGTNEIFEEQDEQLGI